MSVIVYFELNNISIINKLTVITLRSTRLFLDTSLLSGTIGLFTVVVVVNKSFIGCTTKNWAVIENKNTVNKSKFTV